MIQESAAKRSQHSGGKGADLGGVDSESVMPNSPSPVGQCGRTSAEGWWLFVQRTTNSVG